jgi:hypothetical protein
MHHSPRIRSAVSAICIALLLFALFPPKEKKILNWDNVLKLREGDLITVVLFSKVKYSGKVERVEPNSLALTAQEGPLLIPRERIKKIHYTRRPKAAMGGAGMMLGGIGVMVGGMVVGTAKDLSDVQSGNLSGSTGKHGETFMALGAIVAAVGAAILIIGGKPKIIYETKTNQ